MLYDTLLQFDLTYEQLYEMTVEELISTLNNRKKGLAYRMWKQANLNGCAFGGKKFPKSPKEAAPELFPKPKTIEMPDGLRKKLGEKR